MIAIFFSPGLRVIYLVKLSTSGYGNLKVSRLGLGA